MTTQVFLDWFKEWKDVVTTLVAIGAIIVVVVQIRQSGQLERNRLRRDQVAARASLPLTLAALAEYGRAMMKALAPLETWAEKNEGTDPPPFAQPTFPPETIAAVERVISAYPDENAARALAALLGEVQVLQSRSHSFASSPQEIRSWALSMDYIVLTAARITAGANALFDFAREGSDDVEPTRQQLEQVLTLSYLHPHHFPRVWKAAEDYPDDGKILESRRKALS